MLAWVLVGLSLAGEPPTPGGESPESGEQPADTATVAPLRPGVNTTGFHLQDHSPTGIWVVDVATGERFAFEDAGLAVRLNSDGQRDDVRWLLAPSGLTLAISTFPIRDGRLGVHISSYGLGYEGGSGEFGTGNDWLALLDPVAGTIVGGELPGLESETQGRYRDPLAGSRAWAAHFVAGDVDDDGRTELGVVQETASFNHGTEKATLVQKPVRWFVAEPEGWREAPEYEGRWPAYNAELEHHWHRSAVDFMAAVGFDTGDPAQWTWTGGAPAFVPAYRRPDRDVESIVVRRPIR